MKNSNIEVLLSSDSSYEELTAEIFLDGKFIALLNQDDGVDNLIIEFPDKNVVEDMVLRKINLDDFERCLELAKQRIRGK